MENTTYTPPALVVVGTVRQLTQGHKTGNFLDASYPVNTPQKDLTFSG